MLDLKVGDEVVVVSFDPHGNDYLQVQLVKKVTKTQAIIADGRRFSLSDGQSVRSSNRWRPRDYIDPTTPQRVRSDALEKCKRASEYLSSVTKDDAVRVAAMIPEEWMK